MHPQLAARHLEALSIQLEKEKAVVLSHLGLVEELARRLHQESRLDLCLTILPVTEAVRREVAELSVRSPSSASQLADMTARLNSISQVILTCVRGLARS